MVKPLNEFGGWLKICQLINVFSLILVMLYFLSALYYAAGAFSSKIPFTDELKLSTVFMVTLFPLLFYYTVKILKSLTIQSPHIPDEISGYIRNIMIFSVIAGIVEVTYLKSSPDMIQQAYDLFRSLIQPIIMNLIWLLYFRKSVRVKEFYGKNAAS
jgi:uncharacterized membrane protein